MFDYQVGVSIPFSSDGKEVLGLVTQASKQLRTEIASLQKQVADLDASITGISATAKAAAADITGLGAAMRASGVAADSSAAASNNAARAYDNIARSASAAAMRVAELNAAVTGGFADARATSASSAFVPPAIRQNGAIALTGMRSVGAQNAAGESLALREEGWASAYFAGRGGFGGGNDNIHGSTAYARGRGPGGPGRGGWGGGRGGGGGYGSDGMPPEGGGFPSGPLVHAGIHAAKIGAEVALGYATDAVYEAAKLQTILVSTANVTGANKAQMDRVRQAAFDVGDQTAMSPVQTAEMFRELSRQSQGSMSFDAMLGLLPQMAKMQVVLGAARGFSPHQTVDSTMALVHLFRKYDPAGQKAMMDTVLRMGELMPDNLQRAVTQMTYFEPILKSLNVPDEDAAALMVALSRFGLGRGKGGTGVRSMVLQSLGPLQLTSHAQGAKAAMLEQWGLLGKDGKSPFITVGKDGKASYDIFGFLHKLAEDSKKDPMAVKKIYSMLGMQGGNIGALMADPVIVDQLKKIHDAITTQKSLGLDSQSHTIFGTANFAFKRAWNDFQGLATEVGTYALPGLTKGFNDLADTMHNGQVWLHQHKEVAAEVNSYVTGVVRETEHFVQIHRTDIGYLAQDALTAGKAISGLATTVVALGGAALSVYGTIHHAIDLIGGLNPIKPPQDHTGDGTLPTTANAERLRRELAKKHLGMGPRGGSIYFTPDGRLNTGTGNEQDPARRFGNWVGGNLFGNPHLYDRTPSAAPSHRQRTRDVVLHSGAVVVQVDARGMSKEEVAEATRKGAKKGVEDALNGRKGHDARHMIARSGAHVTSAHIPAPLTVSH